MTGPTRKPADVEPLLRALARDPVPPAPAEFRERLRAQFIGNAIPVAANASKARLALGRPRWRAVAALGIAAAVAVAVMLPAAPTLHLVSASGSGAIVIDGHPTALERSEEIARRLRPGAELQMPPDGQLDFEIPGIAVMQVAGGSRLTVPSRPGHRFARTLRMSLHEGEVRVATGPHFSGTRLLVVTPEVRAVVTGTTFAVLRNRDASCVCVLEGGVAMVSGAGTDTVRTGFRRSVFRDRRPPLLEPILPMETMKLGMLREQAARTAARPSDSPK